MMKPQTDLNIKKPNIFLDHSVFNKAALLSVAFLIPFPTKVYADSPDASHYAFANYMGTGLYRTSGQNASVLNVPFSFLLDEADDHNLYLRMPLSLGFFNYSFDDLPSGELPESVGTMTLSPGIEYHWFVNEQATLESYVDLGYGHNFTNSSSVGIFSTGTSLVYEFEQDTYSPIWVNRLYYAAYRSSLNDSSDSFAVFQSGVDVGLGIDWQWGNQTIEPRVFVSGRWFFDTLTFINPNPNEEDISTNQTYEVGATLKFSKPLGWEVFGWDGMMVDRLGLSYQNGGGLEAWRLIFSFPI
ncbi:hypothetical protein [Shewanella maritima]|uniref:hypothetical protein n=1 Tax=Shewanella maritima TaxID=2520507 RepID=UPI003734EDC0